MLEFHNPVSGNVSLLSWDEFKSNLSAELHDELEDKLRLEGVQGMVLYRDLELGAPVHMSDTAMIFGPSCTAPDAETAVARGIIFHGRHLYPKAIFIKE